MHRQWKPASSGRLTGIDWSQWLDSARAIDPYLVWADLLGGQNLSTPDTASDRRWPVIVELHQRHLAVPQGILQVCPDPQQAAAVPLVFGCLEIPGAYKRADVNSPTGAVVPTQFITAKVSPRMVEMLLRARQIVRFQLGLPRLGDAAETAITRPPTFPAANENYPRVVVGIIDDGCAFAHPAFRSGDGRTRVHSLWDQDPRRVPRSSMPGKAPWVAVREFAYGAELSNAELQAATALAHSGDEWRPYDYTDFGRWKLDADTHASAPLDADGQPLPPAAQLRGSHGQSVSFLACGYPMPTMRHAPGAESLAPRAALGKDGRLRAIALIDQLSAERSAVKPAPPGAPAAELSLASIDTADQWDIVFVQLPSRTVADTSGGSLAVHVLDAVRYLQERAAAIPYEGYGGTNTLFDSNRLVVNLSYGSFAGGHDGTSILEEALQELVGGNVWGIDTSIVASAGNAHGSRSHADFDLKPGDRGRLVFTVGPDNPLESYLEIWLPDMAVDGRAVHDGLSRRLIVAVKTPAGHVVPRIVVGDAWTLGAPLGLPEAALIFARRVAQSKHGTMLLLAVRSTRVKPGAAFAPTDLHGDWEVELSYDSGAGAVGEVAQRVHAWCERNDLVFGVTRSQQALVVNDPPVRDPSEAEPEAISYLAHGRYTSPDQRTPFGFRPSMSLSSLAGSEPLEQQYQGDFYPFIRANNAGAFVSVGAYRFDDGEMSAISSGGPGRRHSRDAYWDALQGRRTRHQDVRLGPDIDAPADRNAATRGLLAIGTLPGSTDRLSGTSAAAALATRTIANVLYWLTSGPQIQPDPSRKLVRLLVQGPVAHFAEPASRPTLTPVADDAFRRGTWRFNWD